MKRDKTPWHLSDRAMKDRLKWPTLLELNSVRKPNPDEAALRRTPGPALLAEIQSWRGDPALTQWEEGFLASMVTKIRESANKPTLSPLQWEHLWQIQAKLGAPAGQDSGYE